MSQTIVQLEKECQQYLNDWSGQCAEQFSLEEFSEHHNLTPENATIFICNLEDDEIMSELAQGEYTNFDECDRSQFNDGYQCIISDMIKQ